MKGNKIMSDVKNKKWFPYLLLCVWTIFMCFFCVGSSPFLDYMDPDSQNFRLLGRALLNGQIAYVDIFDHKGPYIYFIELLGAALSPHSEWGLFLIEVTCYCTNVCIVFSILYKITNSLRSSFLSAIAFLGIFFNFFTFVTGNLTDSYSVTFQLISIALIVHYYFNDDNTLEHPPLYMAAHGVMACICGLMRPTNAGMWIPFGIILALRLFYYKKYRNFFINLLSLFIGVIIGILPAAIYAFFYCGIETMWFGTIVANMNYTAGASSTNSLTHFLIEFVTDPSFIVVFLSLVSGGVILKYFHNNWIKITFWGMFIGSLIIMNVSLRNDGQYNQLYMVFIIPALGLIFKWLDSKPQVPYGIILSLLALITLIANLQLIKQVTKFGVFHYHYEAALEMKEIMDEYPDDLLLVTGTQSLYYNVTDRLSHIKYFIIYGHGLHYEVFPDATLQQADSICSGENTFVIVNYPSNNSDSIFGVQDIDTQVAAYLAEQYEDVYHTPEGIHTVLYQRKDTLH